MTASNLDMNTARVLVANRGEIALRIIRSLQETGREAVAVYADQDINTQFVDAADVAYALDGTSAPETYLNADKIIECAKRSGSTAVHPGYGFLAEDPTFARAVMDAGLTWIGPPPTAIGTLGDKLRARQTALDVGVAPVPGTETPVQDRDEVLGFLDRHGYPIVLKAADGGGGRGIHVFREEQDLDQFFAGRDLTDGNSAAFFIEKYVPKARHIETQCGRDSHGNFTVYSTRDCSVQRRHQKMIEEAPAPFISDEVEQQLVRASHALFEGVDYVGLGTCEFLLSETGDLYFLEVNPRLQVEHTVTEEVAGVDLVDAQLKIADGDALVPGNKPRGHSIELRVTSEDPADNLTPTTGTVTDVMWPTGPGIRVDTGIGEGDAVAPEFDSMVAKIIVTAPSREQAIARALRVTKETKIEGVKTPLSLYAHILNRDEFRKPTDGNLGIWTRWLEDGVLTDFAEELTNQSSEAASTPLNAGNAQTTPIHGERSSFVIEIDGKRSTLTLPAELINKAPIPAAPSHMGAPPPRAPQPLRSARESTRRTLSVGSFEDEVTSPIQAIVVRVIPKPGDKVKSGDVIVVLESMKMEKYINAPRDAVIESVDVEVGQNVKPGDFLVTLETEDGAK